MTKDEAITTLRNVAWLGTDKKVGQVEEALQIAITALQMDGDTISRQEVLDLIRNGAVSVMVDRALDTYDAVDSIVTQIKQFFAECVEELPSVQPESSQIARDIATIIENEQDMRVALQPEIIRCKDCKHWREGTAFSYCDKLHGMGVLDALDYMTAEDDYCSMAERKE